MTVCVSCPPSVLSSVLSPSSHLSGCFSGTGAHCRAHHMCFSGHFSIIFITAKTLHRQNCTWKEFQSLSPAA
jgi:hypothetical protein